MMPTIAGYPVKYPLHVAVLNIKGPAITDIIKAYHEKNPATIHWSDAFGFRPIHLALRAANPNAVQVLLELGVSDDLQNAKNIQGFTPLQGLEEAMLSNKYQKAATGVWEGYSVEELTCEFLSKRAMGLLTQTDDLEGYIASRGKWGCTCGACVGGWLSKRMRFRLTHHARMAVDLMELEMYQFEDLEDVAHPDPTELCDMVSDYLPLHLHQSMSKTFYQGYQSIFHTIHIFLKNTDRVLSEKVIATRIHGQYDVDFFLAKGGKIRYVFEAITDLAKEQAGNERSEKYFNEDHKDYGLLPTCENDMAFTLVRQMIGLGDE